jgi:hypothetical protein
MRPVFAIVLLATGLAMPGAWAAQPIALHVRTAGDLAEYCGATAKEPATDAKINYCHGFAQAAVDLELQHTASNKPFCFPSPPPSRAATMNEFVSWVRAVPDRRNQPATDGLFHFLGERFPCK